MRSLRYSRWRVLRRVHKVERIDAEAQKLKVESVEVKEVTETR